MREQGFIPDLVALLSDRTYERHFSNILTSIFCFSYDEPGLMLMVQHNLINHVCRILDEFSFDKASHVKCSEKCQVKERDLQQMRPDLFSLDYGLPWELNRSVSVTSALSSCFSPKAAGDISPPWCFNPAASPARMMSPPRGNSIILRNIDMGFAAGFPFSLTAKINCKVYNLDRPANVLGKFYDID